jgi:uncharacterized membrane protein
LTQGTRGLGGWLAPPRFLLFLVLFPAGALLWHGAGHGLADAVDLGFDGAALVFLASCVPMVLVHCDSVAMRAQSARNDANRLAVLGITSCLTVAIMAAIMGELPRVGHGGHGALAKVLVTLVLTWLFANVVYALHYAHLYYSPGPDGDAPGKDMGGLDFPGGQDPDYFDFIYFAFTLGMTFQTADVAMTGRPIRRIAVLHTFAAFVFNIGVIAFTINAIGGSA